MDEFDDTAIKDERLELIFTCCHPALPLDGQVALTLRALGGLETADIARAFLVSEVTMKRRLSRAKAKIKATGIPFAVPGAHLLPDRLDAVLAVIYLIYNEGYSGRVDLAAEAIRLGRVLTELMPDEPEAYGLLALMMIHHARRGPGSPVTTLCCSRIRTVRCGTTRRSPGGGRRSIRRSRCAGAAPGDPAAALRAVDGLGLDGYLYFHSTRGELLRRLGRAEEAREAYDRALELATSIPERRFLTRRLEQL
jgi:RNA polymerase sigma-70 factor (ECF subfamily)